MLELSFLRASMAVHVLLLLVAFMLLSACTALLKWNEVKYRRKKGLPPGTMGWPFFGETTEFLKQGPNFMKNQRARSFHPLLCITAFLYCEKMIYVFGFPDYIFVCAMCFHPLLFFLRVWLLSLQWLQIWQFFYEFFPFLGSVSGLC